MNKRQNDGLPIIDDLIQTRLTLFANAVPYSESFLTSDSLESFKRKNNITGAQSRKTSIADTDAAAASNETWIDSPIVESEAGSREADRHSATSFVDTVTDGLSSMASQTLPFSFTHTEPMLQNPSCVQIVPAEENSGSMRPPPPPERADAKLTPEGARRITRELSEYFQGSHGTISHRQELASLATALLNELNKIPGSMEPPPSSITITSSFGGLTPRDIQNRTLEVMIYALKSYEINHNTRLLGLALDLHALQKLRT